MKHKIRSAKRRLAAVKDHLADLINGNGVMQLKMIGKWEMVEGMSKEINALENDLKELSERIKVE